MGATRANDFPRQRTASDRRVTITPAREPVRTTLNACQVSTDQMLVVNHVNVDHQGGFAGHREVERDLGVDVDRCGDEAQGAGCRRSASIRAPLWRDNRLVGRQAAGRMDADRARSLSVHSARISWSWRQALFGAVVSVIGATVMDLVVSQ